jgi:nucleoside-diphosphate-sugar epimerase
MNGTYDAERNYLYIDDLIEIIKRVINKTQTGKYSCTYPTNIRLSEIVYSIQRALGKKEAILFDKEKEDIRSNIFYNDTRLYKEIDFFPSISLEEGIRRMIK